MVIIRNGWTQVALTLAVTDYKVLSSATGAAMPLAAFGAATIGLQERLGCTLPEAAAALHAELMRLGLLD